MEASINQELTEGPGNTESKVSGHEILAGIKKESKEFQRQSENYAEYLQHHGISTKYLSLKGKNHFNIMDDFFGDGGAFCEKINEWSQ